MALQVLVEQEAGVEKAGLVEELRVGDQVRILWIGLPPLPDFLNQRMPRIDLKNSLILHHGRSARVSKCLELGDLLHGRRPTVLARDDDARRARQAVGHSHGRNVVHLLLPPGTQAFEVGRCLFAGLVNVLEAVLGNVRERLALILGHVGGDILVERIVEEDDLEPFGVQHLDER